MSIFVGNLPWATTDEELEALFAPYGEVKRSKIVLDRETRRSRGFGFVDMEEEAAAGAIEALNGQPYNGRVLTVNLAQSRPARA
ncbi:MAG: RNA-binding protein [Symbiobacterium thermophilum]|uniref:RNA-binding protein n=1 Tax=Symbiobacterium thermophilum TaxID=2734 RepID=A0A953LIV6_SYMTR|nr:RNA-binding protein [Symbiobacterium thermophilum]